MKLTSLRILDFKAFRDSTLDASELEVLVGANGSGKSSVFELLQFIRDTIQRDMPPEVIQGFKGQFLFHLASESARFGWQLRFTNGSTDALSYEAHIVANPGNPSVFSETVREDTEGIGADTGKPLLTNNNESLKFSDIFPQYRTYGGTTAPTRKRLMLSLVYDKNAHPLYELRESISSWKFYRSSNIYIDKIRSPVLVEQNAACEEDCNNLSSVLHYLMTEHPLVFDEIQLHLSMLVPGFSHLSVRAYGGPGQIMVFWTEKGVHGALSLADLSDGILRLLCWMAILLHPEPPALLCLDEPDIGVHPRTLPLLAGLIKKASAHAQVFVATHNSYFLSHFPMENVVVLKKQNGCATFKKPGESKTLLAMLDDFGNEELENLHRSDELEAL